MPPHGLEPTRLLCPWGFSMARILEWVAKIQGLFPTQGSNPDLPHCRWILYHLSHQGSPPGKSVWSLLQASVLILAASFFGPKQVFCFFSLVSLTTKWGLIPVFDYNMVWIRMTTEISSIQTYLQRS